MESMSHSTNTEITCLIEVSNNSGREITVSQTQVSHRQPYIAFAV